MRIVKDSNLTEHLKTLSDEGYKYIIKAKDTFLMGWGNGSKNGHIQLIACKTREEKEAIMQDLKNDRTMHYIDWQMIDQTNAIKRYTYGKSYTIRNDWTRHLND